MSKKLLLPIVAGLTAQVFASGFGLYEASSPTYALGGAVVGRAIDASANFFNPATLTDLTNLTVTAGFMTEHPRGRMKSNYPNGQTSSMDPGVFCLPHFHLALPLPADFTFGLGIMPEYGLGSEYNHNWDLNFNSVDTTVTSFTVNPNLAYKITDNWSLGAGMRFLFFDFEQHSYPMVISANHRFKNRLKGDNGMADYGYQVGTSCALLDNLSFGLVYKSMTRVHVKGTSRNRLASAANPETAAALTAAAALKTGPARTSIDLPQSLTAGFNWDLTPTWHLGGTIAWTDWSSIGTLHFHLPGQTKPINLNWEDTWRVGLAPSWDFAENWTAMASYVFETDCCGDQDSTMLPPSTRHLLAAGLVWHFNENLDLGLTYGLILMQGNDSDCTEVNVSQTTYRYRAHRALSHAAGFTVTWRF